MPTRCGVGGSLATAKARFGLPCVHLCMHACGCVCVCVFVRARVRTCVTTLLQEGASQESEIPLRQDCSFSLGLRVSGARLLL